MAKFNCFSLLTWNKKKATGGDGSSSAGKHKEGIKILKIKLERPFDSDESRSTTFTVPIQHGFQEDSVCNVKVAPLESPRSEAAEVTYEAEDEHDEHASIKKEFSAIDLRYYAANGEEFEFKTRILASPDSFQAEKDVEMIQSGHNSDPGISRVEFRATPKLKRSCSNIEARDVQRKMDKSVEASQRLCLSPASIVTHCSADRVMLKRHSSSQVLPSRSKRLWWKLFLWSHRNVHKHRTKKPVPHLPIVATSNQHGGYSSDTVEPHRAMKTSKMESPGSYTRESLHYGLVSGLWPQKQWVAFPAMPSSLSRVDEWVRDLEIEIPQPAAGVNGEEGITFPSPPQTGKSPARDAAHSPHHSDIDLSEAVLHANNVIQTLNSSSTVAHISGICLKATPIVAGFTGLRTVNLSNNFIGHITPGSLPKRLHTLNLSRNKINTIEGLRELTRLRVVDLSYNRITRIGHGLSNCILIKELYLTGNKIGDVQGLHRLLKLTVLDLSFNKITTTKELGQLAANYNSLQALNLLGNPIQSNVTDDQLRKAVSGLLPKLTYLNKQPIKPQRGREAVADTVVKAALGSGSRSSRRKTTTKRGSHGGSTSTSTVHKSCNKNKSKSQHGDHRHFCLMSPAPVASSR